MFDWIKRFLNRNSGSGADVNTPPAQLPAPQKQWHPKPAPASLDTDYLEQLRIFGGVTVTPRDEEAILDLESWGYLIKNGRSIVLSVTGKAALGGGGFSPNPDPRTDR